MIHSHTLYIISDLVTLHTCRVSSISGPNSRGEAPLVKLMRYPSCHINDSLFNLRTTTTKYYKESVL